MGQGALWQFSAISFLSAIYHEQVVYWMMEGKWADAKDLLRPYVRIIRDGYSVVLVLVYRHLGESRSEVGSPFAPAISEIDFKQQIKFLSRLGRFVSLGEIREARNLGTINFAVTFDGVSSSILSVKSFLESRAIPYAVCASTETTAWGLGIVDKILAIEECIPRNDVLESVKSRFGADAAGQVAETSLYRFYIDGEFDPVSIEACIVNPLFDRVSTAGEVREVREVRGVGRAYLSWDEIGKHFLQNPLATVVNHSARCLPMDRLSREAIRGDVTESIERFQRKLKFMPEYYAVPFGGVNQDVALDLMDSLYDYNYKGILWTNGGGNLVKEPYRAQMIHLSRVYAPSNLAELLKILAQSIAHSRAAIVEHIRPATRQGNFEIISSDNPRPALLFDNLVRQGKDYSSDRSFYNYYFRQNPYKEESPDYFAVVSSGRMEATIYDLHYRFSLGAKSIKGSYFCSWRKLPVSHKHASARLLLKALKTEPIVGGSSTNPLSTKALRSWKRIPVNAYRVGVKRDFEMKEMPLNYSIEEYGEFPDSIEPLTAQVNENYYFTVERSPAFYRWRFDCYPLAKTAYFVLFSNGKPQAYFVTLHKESVLSISDFYCSTVRDFALLLRRVISFGLARGISTVYVETSLPDISAHIEDRYRSRPEQLLHYYFFNPAYPEVASCWEEIESNWEERRFHETQACGDVLLK